MTAPYEWNPMPHRLDVRCPGCSACAHFDFATAVQIRLRSDVPFFQASSQFEYAFFRGRWAGQASHVALYFQGLHGPASTSIHGLPEGYAASEWEPSRYLVRDHGMDLGSISCARCGYRRRHELRWPDDAFYQIDYRGEVLWAFNRESAVELCAFVESKDRARSSFRWRQFLLHIPSYFLTAKAREQVVKRLRRALTS